MIDPLRGDHAVGIELQIEELVERRARASRQGDLSEAERIDGEIAGLHAELARTMDPSDASWWAPERR